MSMYKTIFWSDSYSEYAAGDQVSSVSGEVLVFGESAFASLDEAVAYANGTLGGNAIVIKVASGKYDGYTVINEGVQMNDVRVTAVDFSGADVMIGGEMVNVANGNFSADEQAAIIDGLNDIKGGAGEVFVAAGEHVAADKTMYIGAGNSGYTAGATDVVVSGNSFDDIVTILGNMNQSAEATASGNEIYVSADYNSSTEGWGTTHFGNYQSAYNYASVNNKTAIIVVDKTTTLSGNTFDNNHKNSSKLAVVIKDGASLGDALSKWDMTYAVTVEAGGTITAARPASASVSNIHIKNTLTIGTEGSDKKAYSSEEKSSKLNNPAALFMIPG